MHKNSGTGKRTHMYIIAMVFSFFMLIYMGRSCMTFPYRSSFVHTVLHRSICMTFPYRSSLVHTVLHRSTNCFWCPRIMYFYSRYENTSLRTSSCTLPCMMNFVNVTGTTVKMCFGTLQNNCYNDNLTW